MARRGSLPWLIIAAVLSIILGIFLVSALLTPYTDALMALPQWRNSTLDHANAGQRMVGDFVNHFLLVLFFGIAVGFLIDARRGV